MQFGHFLLTTALVLTTAMPASAKTYARRGPTSPKTKHSKTKTVGQRGIDDARATQIQTALAKSGYLTGEPSGHWDSSTEAAMQKFQADNGWQTKLTPDSRAIIKLGLGPSQTSELTASSPAVTPPATTPSAPSPAASFK
jgi:peptidoglycan hydrolase-like protein with peptidoglycan-binding domain